MSTIIRKNSLLLNILRKQAELVGFPVEKIPVPSEEYLITLFQQVVGEEKSILTVDRVKQEITKDSGAEIDIRVISDWLRWLQGKIQP